MPTLRHTLLCHSDQELLLPQVPVLLQTSFPFIVQHGKIVLLINVLIQHLLRIHGSCLLFLLRASASARTPSVCSEAASHAVRQLLTPQKRLWLVTSIQLLSKQRMKALHSNKTLPISGSMKLFKLIILSMSTVSDTTMALLP